MMQGGYPIGYLLAAITMRAIAPHFGWRSAFFVGAPVAVLVAILTTFAPESKAWRVQRASSLGRIGRSLLDHKKIFTYLLILMAVMLSLSH
jgi:SHS family lactate transporter-like MFS transporter